MYIELISAIAGKVGVNAMMLLSICTVETGLKNRNNYSDPSGGSFGVCQLQERTAKEIMPHIDRLALQQPQVNITIAAMYLRKLDRKYGNMWDSVAAYNAGKPRVVNGIYKNAVYVNKVKSVYVHLQTYE